MADMRQRSVKEELKSEAKARRAQSVLIYGEQSAPGVHVRRRRRRDHTYEPQAL